MRNLSLSAAAIGFLATGVAQASLTDAGKLGANEPGFIGILEGTFGQTFRRVGANYVGDTYTIARVADDGSDSFIPAGQYAAEIIASYSDNPQDFGLVTGEDFHPVAHANGYGMLKQAPVVFGDANAITLGRNGGESGLQTSVAEHNPNNKDNLITFRVEANDAEAAGNDADAHDNLLLFWEDLSDGPGVGKNRSNADYNDLVVMLSNVDNAEAVAPLPAGALGGLFVMGGGLITAVTRKLRR